MTIHLYNTMTRSLEELKTIEKNKVKLYICGPTVYNYQQIGNWATFIRWDTLIRTLKLSGYEVESAMSITDVGHLTSDADTGEDKLEKGAKREGKTAWEIAKFYTQDFIENLKKFNIEEPTHLVKATGIIQDQIDFVKKLEEKNLIYKIDDGVYFDTSKLEDYGKLAKLNIEKLKEGARIEPNPQKKNPTDFAVWKFSPKNSKRDMEWDSPWGKGFPGWHIECSAIVMRYLGKTIDIHTGGIDHIPVHHTNEIAQTESITNKPLANIWLHSNFITANGTKLSKSLGNSYTPQDIVAKGFDLLDLRMLFLQSHYRTQADFSWEALTAARNQLKNLRAMADLRFQPSKDSDLFTNHFDIHQQDILKALQNDLNTPQALAKLNSIPQDKMTKNNLQEFKNFLKFLDDLFGLRLLESEDINENQKQLIEERETARNKKNFAKADQIREQLLDQGIELRDTGQYPIWNRVQDIA